MMFIQNDMAQRGDAILKHILLTTNTVEQK